jgi:sugar O-acyltransferase (sialic acid O-acetyltransferase NeuD family)
VSGDARAIFVIGASGHAKVAIDAIERMGGLRIAGLIDSLRCPGETAFGYSVLGAEDDLPVLARSHGAHAGVVAIGDNWQRWRVAKRLLERAPGFEFVTVIHPAAQLSRGVEIGRGSVVMAGAVLNADARVGEFCIVNTRASVDHDCVLEDHSSVAPGATLGGGVVLGAFSAVGIGATVRQRVTIGPHCVLGAGALVLADLPGYCVAWGVPAKFVRGRIEGERYL